MAGMGDKAMEAARIVSTKVPKEVALQVYWIQNVIVLPQLTAVTFGRWQEVLDAPMPDPELEHATMMAHYARGTALAALGRADEARAELAVVQAAADAVEGPVEAQPVPAIAAHSLAGEIALRGGDAVQAVEHFRAAADLEDGMVYEEPPVWYYPVRHSLGRALLEAGRPAEAEAAYREDLARFRENGWSLSGLARALEAQGRAEEAADVRARFEKAWEHADVELKASRI
jgi:predicted Zn-dependent protease